MRSSDFVVTFCVVFVVIMGMMTLMMAVSNMSKTSEAPASSHDPVECPAAYVAVAGWNGRAVCVQGVQP